MAVDVSLWFFFLFFFLLFFVIFFFNDTATTEIYTLSLHDALPIWTTITILNAGRKISKSGETDFKGKLFLSSGLGGMSGAQPKAGNISEVISVVAEVNKDAVEKRHIQG